MTATIRKKTHKLPIKNIINKSRFAFGQLGLKALEPGEITNLQLNTVRKLLAPFLRRKNRIVWRIFPLSWKTSKSFGSRMGSGKGDLTVSYAKVRRGQFLFEIIGTSLLPIVLLRKICSKLNIKTLIVFRGL